MGDLQWQRGITPFPKTIESEDWCEELKAISNREDFGQQIKVNLYVVRDSNPRKYRCFHMTPRIYEDRRGKRQVYCFMDFGSTGWLLFTFTFQQQKLHFSCSIRRDDIEEAYIWDDEAFEENLFRLLRSDGF